MIPLEDRLRLKAREEGFADLRIADPGAAAQAGGRLQEFLSFGREGDMAWLKETAARRADPRVLWPGARSAILLAMSYAPEIDPLERLARKDTGVISVYALGRDYHDVIKGKLKQLAQWLARETQEEVKVFVDTAPLMEKPLAEAAGLGWQGKHTNLVSRSLGSWFFLGAILSAAELARDPRESDHCGTCRACLDICPTKAFPAPYQLDARRCISYLTIEYKGHIADEFREAIGNRIYGCDDCLAACPWNKFAGAAHEAKLKARDDLIAPKLADLARLDDQAFRQLFTASPVKRSGRDRFIRNVLIAIGNSGDAGLAPEAERLLGDESALVRAMAVWALSRLLDAEDFATLRDKHAQQETDDAVAAEWQKA
ncbi:tRNA epoxyqueuosine(34) reductase QueG [Aestuariivirga sp. YIM B02566]|uniref:tRNA epoxyqueuosine(34) reductase QueG n=1 Tax=Taklimakanibacter albus TaxID=2800327 RepID=A0ACC5REH1_9HYPH|nr:tRNA epoxyqueuosine(34) reductase QueG [Aestuariivirga sp. YIM B02566]MBK1871096.1 tRNA epoxyqueuosine(34) reductase QueG [Aestuariivirga sp. YIM B02566]